MPVYGAFLRAMNVGGRRVTNDELRAAFESMGFEGVFAFLASGNVVFESASRSVRKLERQIEEGLERDLGYAVPTCVRAAAAIHKIAVRQPFPDASVAASAGSPQVAVLSDQPSAADRDAAMALATADDLLAIEDGEMYWLPKGMISDSGLNVKAIERILGPMTIRTQRTMVRLAAKLG
ncbi:MAG: DUF1697 domain-containing protein [bacterium]|nr:DUF1697 domain-containing protein [bacterium]